MDQPVVIKLCRAQCNLWNRVGEYVGTIECSLAHGHTSNHYADFPSDSHGEIRMGWGYGANGEVVKVIQHTHIAQVPDKDKTAKNLSENLDPGNDEYHQNIVNAAKKLVATNRGGCMYATQWISGSTLWEQEWPPQRIIVTVEGNITIR